MARTKFDKKYRRERTILFPPLKRLALIDFLLDKKNTNW